MKKLLSANGLIPHFAGLIPAVAFGFTVAQGQTIFQKTYGTTGSETGYIVRQTADKGYIIAGGYGYFVKTDSLGNKIWSENINLPSARDIIQTQDGGYIICGGYVQIPSYSFVSPYIVKLNSSGNIVWQNAYKISYFAEYFNSIQEAIDGTGYIVVGPESWSGYNMVIMKINSSGSFVWGQWIQPLGQSGTSPIPWGFVQLKSDSSILIVSTYRYGGSNEGILLSKYSKNGNAIWTKSLSSSGMVNTYGHQCSIKETYNGNYRISFISAGCYFDWMDVDTSGTVLGNASRYIVLNTYNTNWSSWTFVEPSVNNSMYLLATSPNGNPASAGASDIVLAKTNSSGSIMWSKRVGGKNVENAGNITMCTDKSAVIVGGTKSFSVGQDDVYLVKTDSIGTFSCNTDSFLFPTVQIPTPTSSNFYCTYNPLSLGFNSPWNFIVTNPNDTSYNACGCVPPKANISTDYPNPNCGWIQDNSTWATTWFWDYGNGQTDTSLSPSPNYGFTDSTYYVCLKVSNACGSDSTCDSINYVFCPVSVQNISNDSKIKIYPNPFSTQTTLHTDLPDGRQAILHNATLTVYNCFGQQVKQFVISRNEFGTGSNSDLPTGQAGSFVIRRDNLPSGLYFIRLTQDNKIITTDKIVITDK